MKEKQQKSLNAAGGTRLRRRYDQQFKQEAVKMLRNGMGAKEVSQLLGVSEQLLYNWRSQEMRLNASENNLELKAARADAKQLRKKLKEVEIERDILKRALNIFSRPTS